MLGGGDVALTASRRGDLGAGRKGRKHGGLAGLLTGRAVRLAGEHSQGLRFFGALAR
jgi:hypothetical protein